MKIWTFIVGNRYIRIEANKFHTALHRLGEETPTFYNIGRVGKYNFPIILKEVRVKRKGEVLI